MKKTLRHPKANEELRVSFSEKIQCYQQEGRQLVYLDESGFSCHMPRTHGYAPTGAHCYGTQDWHAKTRVNAIGVISDFSFVTLALFNTTINSDVFFVWLTQDLLPKIPANAVLIMDNTTFHKRADIIQMINNHGITLEYLPPYSPDLNPIEHKWAQAKATMSLQCSGKPAIHMVSAFATGVRLVLAQQAVAEKSNEITAIPKLLALLDLKGHIITIDAMDTQRAIAEQIIDQGGDYILALKGNQGTLNEDVRLFLETELKKPCSTVIENIPLGTEDLGF